MHRPFSLRLSLIGRLLCLLAVLGLSGCFDIRQKFTVDEQGDAELLLTLAVSQDLTDAAEQGGHSADCDTDFGFEGSLPPTLTKTSATRIEDDQLLCDVSVVGPLLDMIPVMEAYTAQKAGNDFVRIKDLGAGRFALVGHYDFSDDSMEQALKDTPSGLEKAIRGALIASLDDAAIRWQVSAPHIVQTNGVVDEHGDVQWSVPLSDAVMAGHVYTFEVIFETAPKPQFF